MLAPVEHALVDLDSPFRPRRADFRREFVKSPREIEAVEEGRSSTHKKGFLDLDDASFYGDIVADLKRLLSNEPLLEAFGLPGKRWTAERRGRDVVLRLRSSECREFVDFTDQLATFFVSFSAGVKRVEYAGGARWRLRLESAW